MNITEEQLATLEELGKCQFNAEQCAIIIEVKPEELKRELQTKTSAAFQAFNRGRLKAEFEIRKAIYDHASRNSSEAQKLYMKLCEQLKIEELS